MERSARRRARRGRAPARRRPRRCGFALREKLGATEFLGYETESAEGVVRGARSRRQGSARAEDRRERRGRPQPDAVLRRIRRSGRRHRRDERRRRALRASPTRRSTPAICSCTSARSSRARSRSAPRWRSRSITRAAARSAPTIRRRICCTRRCARCSAITSRRRARWSRPTGCASTSRIPSR